MSIRGFTFAVVTSLFALSELTLGCNNAKNITGPTGLTVSGLSPAAGAADSADAVNIYGTGFQPGVTVTFDGVAADVGVVTTSTIRVITPVHSAGDVDVVVTNPDGMSRSLTRAFSYQLLTVMRVNPSTGLSGDVVRIVGTGIGTGAVVTIGGIPARVTSSDNFSTIEAIVPDHGPGQVDVVVTNPTGGRATLAAGFVYGVPPVSLSVSSTLVAAGSEITVSWTTTSRLAPDANDDFVCLVEISTGALAWCYSTFGASAGTQTLTAPSRPGQYQFEYRIPDDFVAPYYRILSRIGVTVAPLPEDPRAQSYERG